jgi:hypothetical protein
MMPTEKGNGHENEDNIINIAEEMARLRQRDGRQAPPPEEQTNHIMARRVAEHVLALNVRNKVHGIAVEVLLPRKAISMMTELMNRTWPPPEGDEEA